ncbi:hypothetical protein B0H13DRAFT_2303774 [Mycena leptocephala]|nr:hypothetical protein B0H13DRAFT_2303774 [Mycena leptocephala]
MTFWIICGPKLKYNWIQHDSGMLPLRDRQLVIKPAVLEVQRTDHVVVTVASAEQLDDRLGLDEDVAEEDAVLPARHYQGRDGEERDMREGRLIIPLRPPMGVEVDDLDDEWATYAYEFTMATKNNTTPKSINKTLAHPKAAAWSAAIGAELDGIEKHETWELVKAPPGANIIVFQVKRDAIGAMAHCRDQL